MAERNDIPSGTRESQRCVPPPDIDRPLSKPVEFARLLSKIRDRIVGGWNRGSIDWNDGFERNGGFRISFESLFNEELNEVRCVGSKGILNFWWIEEARRERRIKYQVKGGIIKGIGIVLNGENIEDLSKWNYFKFLTDEIVGSKMWYKIEWIEGRVVRRNSCMFLICDTLYFKPLRIDLQLFRVFPFYQTISPLIRHFHMSGK